MKNIKKVADLLKEKSLNETTVSASHENSIDKTLEIVGGYDAETLDVITQINTHSYNGSQLQALNTFAKENGKTLWMSEFGAGGTEEHNHQDMTSAMELADRIIKDLRLLQDRKSTRLNSSHVAISYAVFCLKKNICKL